MTQPVILAGSAWFYVLLAAIGFIIGTYGTMVGLGGGVVLLPVLLLLFPGTPPVVLTGVSLSVVLLNALSGTIAYARQRRIDYRSGWLFALATVPGTIVGVWLVQFINLGTFKLIFGVLLLVIAVVLIVRPQVETPGIAAGGTGEQCRLENGSGSKLTYRPRRALGMVTSFGVGFMAGLLGIGGGVIHVPAMVYLLCFPVHIATATSHFILIFTTLTGVATHLALRTNITNWLVVVFLALGIIPGAQLGAFVSHRLRGPWIIRLLSFALIILGVRLLLNL